MNAFRQYAAICLGLILMAAAPVEARVFAISMPRPDDNFQNVIRDNLDSEVRHTGDFFYSEAADGDFENQLTQLKKFVDAGVDAVFLIPLGTSKEDIARIISTRGNKNVPFIFINTQPEDDAFPLPPMTTYIGSNELESGTLEMEALAREAGYKGKVAILQGEMSHHAAITRTKDVEDVVAKYPGLEITLRETGNWRRNEALSIVSGWLKEKPDAFTIIAANNDEMALGAVLAMEQQNISPNKYLIGGVDATPDALSAMQQGKMTVTVLQDAAGQARAAVDAAYKMLVGRSVDQKIWVPFRLVTKDNLYQFIN